MKKILLIGKRGFLGNSLNKFLRKKFKLRFVSFIDLKKIKKSLTNYDYIINTSINKDYINKKYDKKFDNDLKISNYLNPKKNTLIFFSSRKVYKSKKNIKENDKLLPLSYYSKNKLKTEKFLKKKFKSNLLILRISNIIGNKLNFKKKLHKTFVDLFYEKARKGLVYDNGKKYKDFLSIQKFSQILIMLIKKDLKGTYNVSIGQKVYLNQIITWLNKYNKRKLKVIKHNFSKNESFYLNNKKLMSKIKIKNNLFELKKDCLSLSKKLFN
tara:strand:- start:68 stop:874 length:807 start_codon:yes stop_codon:yes gene_type:complete